MSTRASLTRALLDAEDRTDRMRMEADTCSLTGLLNRRGFLRRTANRDWGWYVAVDLDGFKAAQDAHPDGHEHGDGILREFAEFLYANTRQGSPARDRDLIAARTGGDEFTLWTETRVGAQRIKKTIRTWRDASGAVTASAGIGVDAGAADGACYLHKSRLREAPPVATAEWRPCPYPGRCDQGMVLTTDPEDATGVANLPLRGRVYWRCQDCDQEIEVRLAKWPEDTQ